jgi:glucose-6-phosphate isomerase
MWAELQDLKQFTSEILRDGFTDAVLLGMGGSSLAPEVFSKTLGKSEGFLRLHILDSTDPGQIRAIQSQIDLQRTLFIVATKSGGTVETLSGFKYFFNRIADAVGNERAGGQFIAITDPGSSLETLGQKHRFRSIFRNDPNIGGRYSALSHFGLVPAALTGVDLERVLSGAIHEIEKAQSDESRNAAAATGAVIGTLAQLGKDKLTFIIPGPLASFGDWAEQLIAESTGKDNVGILPVVGEPLGVPSDYNIDRTFVLIRHYDDESQMGRALALGEAGRPVITMTYEDLHDLGGMMFLWEMATSVAGHVLGIQPFDQPNVESAKVRARSLVANLERDGELLPSKPAAREDGIEVHSHIKASSVSDAINQFVEQTRFGDYIAIQAYLTPSPQNDELLSAMRVALRTRFRCATTVGYGPRFLHSTGQLHKGDRGNGLFIQITCEDLDDILIPDNAGSPASTLSFGKLKLAQALGDGEALRDSGRRLLRVHLADQADGLAKLVSMLR